MLECIFYIDKPNEQSAIDATKKQLSFGLWSTQRKSLSKGFEFIKFTQNRLRRLQSTFANHLIGFLYQLTKHFLYINSIFETI